MVCKEHWNRILILSGLFLSKHPFEQSGFLFLDKRKYYPKLFLFLIIFHIFSLVYNNNKAEMAKFEHFLGFE